MEPVKEDTVINDERIMEIPGYEGMVFLPKTYRNQNTDPMEVSYFLGRHARQTIRMVLLVHRVEPNWEKAPTLPTRRRE